MTFCIPSPFCADEFLSCDDSPRSERLARAVGGRRSSNGKWHFTKAKARKYDLLMQNGFDAVETVGRDRRFVRNCKGPFSLSHAVRAIEVMA